ncbi:MAG: FG-GAP-like repeat-containing protein [bacterium]
MKLKTQLRTMLDFWQNPEISAIRTIIILGIVILFGFFVFRFSHHNPFGNKGVVFESSAGSPTGLTHPRSVTAGDFDQDGKLDLATVDPQNPSIVFLKGNGDGTFQAPVSIPLPATALPVSITSGKFHSASNNHLDLAVVDYEDNRSNTISVPSFSILPSVPPTGYIHLVENGTLASMQTTSTPSFSFNLSATGPTTDPITLTYGGSCSSSTTTATTGTNTITFNTLADGTYNDCTISAADAASNTSNLLVVPRFTINRTPVSTSTDPITAPTITQVLPIPDPTTDQTPRYTFHSDKDGTIVYGGSCSSSTTTALQGDNTITFNSMSPGIYSDCTIQITNKGNNALILDGDGTGHFTLNPSETVAFNKIPETLSDILSQDGTIVRLSTSDMNGDGFPDLIEASYASGYTPVLAGNGSGGFTYLPFGGFPAGYVGNVTKDINSDGYGDIVAEDFTSGSNSYFLNTTHAAFDPTPHMIVPTGSGSGNGSDRTTTGDFNHDGHVDAASYDQVNGQQIFITQNDGSGNFTPYSLAPLPAGVVPLGITSGDFNGDGWDDIAIVDKTTGNAYVILTVPPSAAPTVTNVTSPTTDGTYGSAHPIPIQVTFSAPVKVTGTPQLILKTGTTATTPVDYISGTGTDTLTFGYTVASGDTSSDLDYASTTSLGINGGTITDNATGLTDANLTLPTPGTTGSLGSNKTLVIDGIAPTLTTVTPLPVTTPTTNFTFHYADNIAGDATLTYPSGCTGNLTTTPQGDFTVILSSITGLCTIEATDVAGNPATITFDTGTSLRGGGGRSGGIPPPPTISELVPVATPTINHTPKYTFGSNTTGTITYSGGCSSSTTSAINGSNTITFNSLPDGTYNGCTIRLTDGSAQQSNILSVTGFTVTTPVITQTTETQTNQNTQNTQTKTTTSTTTKKIAKKVTPVSPTIPSIPVQTEIPLPPPEVPSVPVQTEQVPTPVPTVIETPITQPQPVVVAPCTFGPSSTPLAMIRDQIETVVCLNLPPITSRFTKIETSYEALHLNTFFALLVLTLLLLVLIFTSISGLFLTSLSGLEFVFIPARLISLFVAGLGFKKNTPAWGKAYNSITKEPLDPVRITLIGSDGKQVAATLTNLSGSFGFSNVQPGTYTLVATKAHYAFPSKHAIHQDHDEVYRHINRGETITITQRGEIPRVNIPLDPENFDLAQFLSTQSTSLKLYSVSDRVIPLVTTLIFTLGSIGAVALFMLSFGPATASLVLFALCLYSVRRKSLDAIPFGYIFDAKTGVPISFGVIRISSRATGQDIVDCVLDATGKYSYPLPDGSYLLKVDRKLPNEGYHTIAKNIPVESRQGYLAQTLHLTIAQEMETL